jgi:hypothetical protein
MFSNHVIRNISAYCHGELSADDSRQFAEHIISCAKCRTKYEEIKVGIKFAEQLTPLAAPDYLWSEIESQLSRSGPGFTDNSSFVFRRPVILAIAASLLLVVSVGAWWVYLDRVPAIHGPSWQVQSLEGTPTIASRGISSKGQLGVGQWLVTDGNSRAQIAVSSIGNVDIEENTQVKLVGTKPTEHRLELARGKMSARIWAPPRLFFVDTPSAVAADLGCAYTLEVDDHGASLLRVTSGWVALELKDRESIVPAGAACETRPGVGPGTPYFEDCAGDFRAALQKVDFPSSSQEVSSGLDFMLNNSRSRDTLTLWHLLSRVEGPDRAKVYDRIAMYSPPPAGVTREGILRLDKAMLELWKEDLRPTWYDRSIVPAKVAQAFWKAKYGVDRRLNKLK